MAEGKVRGLIIAVEKYGQEAGLPDLPGTLDRACEFRQWLLGPGGAASENIVFAAAPRVPEATHDGTAVGILKAVSALVSADKDDTARLFVFHTGHGFQLQSEQREGALDVIIGTDFDPQLGGYSCVRLQQVRNYLQQAIGNCVQYYFVDACRLANPVLVPDLSLPGRTSHLGRSSHHSLFSAADGAAARSDSSFPIAVLDALAGKGPAKEWRKDRGTYWVTFPSLVSAVKDRMKAEDAELFSENAGDEPPPFVVEVPGVADVPVTLEVAGAAATATSQLRLWDLSRSLSFKMKGPKTVLNVAPGNFEAELTYKGKTLPRTEPKPEQRVLVFEGSEVRLAFEVPKTGRKGDVGFRGSAIRLPDIGGSTATFNVRAPGGAPLRIEAGKRRIDAPAGRYDVELVERGERIGSMELVLGQGDTGSVDLSDLVVHSHVHRAMGRERGPGPTFGLRPDDLLSRPGADPVRTVLDPEPALALSLVGTAAIAGTAPYREAVAKLETFDDLEAGGTAVYALVQGGGAGPATVAIGDDEVALSEVDGLDGVRHGRLDVADGPLDLHIRPAGHRELLLATHTFAGLVTLVVVVADAAPPSIRQYGVVPGHLALALAPEAAGEGRDVVEDTWFAELVQRRFRDERSVAAALDEDDKGRWDVVVSGASPDPFLGVVAGYELVRRGALAADSGTVRALAGRQTQRFGPLVDLAILEALADRKPPPTDGTPLVTDGVAASGPRRREGFVTQEGSGWTLWQRW